MAAATDFDGLALKYVLADKDAEGQRQAISEQAARAIEESTNSRATVHQWVSSIQRWMPPSDEDPISRASALDFLASTLQVLSRRNDTLTADQITLLVNYFCSLFDSDHEAGIAAATKALNHLVVAKYFSATLRGKVLQSVCKLGNDDFKRQAPTTRLEIYHLISTLLGDPKDHTNGLIDDLLNLCQNERDPENLMVWFAILRNFLQNLDPSGEPPSAIFKAFAAFFPISLRPSATASSVTTDDLKSSLRSCFSAHHSLASLSIPFLIEKLDTVNQSVAVKVDILLTINACLVEYSHPVQSIVPYADQTWGALKYEVRNGEIQDIIKETLKVVCSLTKRLDGEDLASFVDSAWRDLKEDISDQKYTAQAGRLLVAIAGASAQSFGLLIPRAMSHINNTIKHNASTPHKRHLIALMSSIVELRLHLVPHLHPDQDESNDNEPLSDELFGDALFHDLFLPFWQEHSVASSPIEYLGLLCETTRGLGALVGQKSSGTGPNRRLCSDSTCREILGLLAKPVITCRCAGSKYFDLVGEIVPDELVKASEEALKNAITLHPPSFQYLLQLYMTSIRESYQLRKASRDLTWSIETVSASLSQMVLGTQDYDARWLNEAALINTFLQGLLWMLTERAEPEFLVIIIDAIHVTVKGALEGTQNTSRITEEEFRELVNSFEASGAPQVDLNQPGKIEALVPGQMDIHRQRRAYCLFVVHQLYRRFTALHYFLIGREVTSIDSDGLAVVKLNDDFIGDDPDLIFRQDTVLNQLGQLATSVVKLFSEEEQKALGLDSEAILLFHMFRSRTARPSDVLRALSPADGFRTAPLSLGIIQGLWPGAIETEFHLDTLDKLIEALFQFPTPCSESARPALDAMLCVLSNKFDVKKDNARLQRRINVQTPMLMNLQQFMGPSQETDIGEPKLQIIRSTLHYLAGDVARPIAGETNNALLTYIMDNGPTDLMMGRDIAQNFGLLVAPRKSLSEENHAIRRKLAQGWFYHRYVVPYFDRCFSASGIGKRDEAVNRAVGILSILRHFEYETYASNVAQIVRIGVQALDTFKVGVETEALLEVLLNIQSEDASQLKDQLTSLISGVGAVYIKACNIADAAAAATTSANSDKMDLDNVPKAEGIGPEDYDPITTRMHVLHFLHKLTESGYDAHLLLPHRNALIRPLAQACGDSVREIRRIALRARQAWEALN